jgi:hypothetical protein
MKRYRLAYTSAPLVCATPEGELLGMDWLRHCHVGVTARVYAPALKQGEQKIMERLGVLLAHRVAASVAVDEPEQPIEMASVRQIRATSRT